MYLFIDYMEVYIVVFLMRVSWVICMVKVKDNIRFMSLMIYCLDSSIIDYKVDYNNNWI